VFANLFDTPRGVALTSTVLLVVALAMAVPAARSDDTGWTPQASPTTTMAEPVGATAEAAEPAASPEESEAPPVDLFQLAVEQWAQLGASQSSPTAGPVLVDGLPLAVSSLGATLLVWTWDGHSWVQGAELGGLAGPAPLNLEAIQLADATGDGFPEILVAYRAGDSALGAVFRSLEDRWMAVPFDLSLLGPDAGAGPQPLGIDERGLFSRHTICSPSCAEGAVLDVRFELVANQFVATRGRCAALRDEPAASDVRLCDIGERVRHLQAALAHFGHLQGTIDGHFGLATRAAVVSYQAANGLEENGRLTAAQLDDLVRAHQAAVAPAPEETPA
jgi:hypothetical protein